MKESFLIYGAYGYTGRLIAKLAVERGLKPTLGGRNATLTAALAQELGLPFVVFDVTHAAALRAALRPFRAVLHCAGPFSETTALVLDACMDTQTHYLDITGEYEVFEYVASRRAEAERRGIVMIPGVGFDVVPSDCLAAFLKHQLPDATHLDLAFVGGSVSRGTALTVAQNLGKPGAERRAGQLVAVPLAQHVREIDFGAFRLLCGSIPWGDISTAYHSTGIPNIRVFMAQPPSQIRFAKMSRHMGWLLRQGWIRRLIERQVRSKVKGPSEQMRQTGKSYLWGQVTNALGQQATARLSTPEAYRLTSLTALEATIQLLEKPLAAGFYTPSLAFGADFILSIEGTERTNV